MGLITGNWIMDIFYFCVALVTAIYLFTRHTYSYWERKNFKTLPNANYLMGHFKTIFLRQQSFANLMLDLYNQTTEPFIGLYSTFRPILFVRDPELIQTILVKDFNNFVNRGIYCNEKDPLSEHLFSLSGRKWRNLRGKLSPTFSSGKLKTMFSTFVASGAPLQKHLAKLAEKGEPIDVRDLAACYTTNNIASVAFGIEVDTIANPNDDFRKFGKRIFEPTIWNTIRGAIAFTAPKLMDFFSIRLTDPDVEKFIFSIVKQNLEYREKYNVTRKDFFQQLIQMVKNGTTQIDDQCENDVDKCDINQKKMTINEMAAQVFVFFIAGYETSATSLAYNLLELAKQPELQKRVQNEIDCVLEKYNGEITFESLSEMKFLGNCFDETLRLHPIPFLNRACLNDYRIPGTDKIIEKGVQIFIPVIGLHHNEKYYPEPLKFKPERFSDEELSKCQGTRPYLPFGDGPRNCIGIRMGIIQVKIGLVTMLQKFNFTLASEEDHVNPTDFDPKSFIPLPKKGIHLNVINRSEFN